MYWQSGWFAGPRPVGSSVRGTLYLRRKGKEESMTKAVKSAATIAAEKAERERDKAQALRDYDDEQSARQANMARLRGLRLAKERAAAKKAAAPRPARKKAAAQTGSASRTSS
jgi:hypothetical protein